MDDGFCKLFDVRVHSLSVCLSVNTTKLDRGSAFKQLLCRSVGSYTIIAYHKAKLREIHVLFYRSTFIPFNWQALLFSRVYLTNGWTLLLRNLGN